MKVNIDETIMYLRIENEKLRQDTDQFKRERNSLIDDLSWCKAKVSRLEHERDYYNQRYRYIKEVCSELEHEDEEFYKLLSEFSQHIGKKPSSSKYKYFRAKLDELSIKEGE